MATCLCSPTSHAGSFRCRLHRNNGNHSHVREAMSEPCGASKNNNKKKKLKPNHPGKDKERALEGPVIIPVSGFDPYFSNPSHSWTKGSGSAAMVKRFKQRVFGASRGHRSRHILEGRDRRIGKSRLARMASAREEEED